MGPKAAGIPHAHGKNILRTDGPWPPRGVCAALSALASWGYSQEQEPGVGPLFDVCDSGSGSAGGISSGSGKGHPVQREEERMWGCAGRSSL